MPVFNYKARDRQGQMYTATVEASDEMEVASSLRAMAYSVISIDQQSGDNLRIPGFLRRITRPSLVDIIFFSRQLASLLKSGIPILTALTSIAEQTRDKNLKGVIDAVAKDVGSGVSFSEALSRHPDIFSEIFTGTVKVGETAGMLDQAMERLSQLNARELEIRTSIRSAMAYPILLVVVAVIVMTFLLVNIIPKFVVIFEAYEARLPLPTLVLLWISSFAQRFWFPAAFGAIISTFIMRGYFRTDKGRYKLDMFLLRFPFFGELYLKVIVARFCRTLSAMIRSGVPMLEALYVSGNTVGNTVIRKVVDSVRTAVTQGQSLAEPFRTSGIFPPTVVQMIALGQKSGKLDDMLQEVASSYDQEVDYTIKNITTTLEPVLLLIMGAMVAFIALSILLPIFNLVKVFRR